MKTCRKATVKRAASPRRAATTTMRRTEKISKIFLLPDCHVPYHDRGAFACALSVIASGRFDRAHAGVLTALAGMDAEEGLVKAAPLPLARADFSRRLIHSGTRVSGGAR